MLWTGENSKGLVTLPDVENVGKHAPGLPRNQSIQRTAQLLWALGERPTGASTAELARVTGLPSATAGRLLATLADLGLAERLKGDPRWVLGRELVRLARVADPYRVFVAEAQPLLVQLARESGESATVSLARVPFDIEVIVQQDAPTMVGARNWLGQRFSAYASAAGKIALASMLDSDQIRTLTHEHPPVWFTEKTIIDSETFVDELARARRDGYAESIDELEDGLTGIAVVIAVDEPDVLVLGLSGPSSRLGAARRRELVRMLRAYASQLERVLVERIGS